MYQFSKLSPNEFETLLQLSKYSPYDNPKLPLAINFKKLPPVEPF